MQIQKTNNKSLLNHIHKTNRLTVSDKDIYLTTWTIDDFDRFVSEKTVMLEFKKGDRLEFFTEPKNKFTDFTVEVYRNDEKIGYVQTLEILSSLLKAGKSLYGVIDEVDVNHLGHLEIRFKIFLKA